MRTTLILLCACVVAASSPASVAAAWRDDEPDVAVVKFGWSRHVFAPMGGGALEDVPAPMEEDNSPVHAPRAIGSRRAPQPTPPSLPTDARGETIAGRSDSRQARDGYEYRVRVRNTGASVVTLVGWDYVFLDAGGAHEIARHHFQSRAKIEPGKEKALKFFTAAPPTRVVSASAPGQALVERVIITRVEYVGDRVWRRN
jgi:hypothetical protein